MSEMSSAAHRRRLFLSSLATASPVQDAEAATDADAVDLMQACEAHKAKDKASDKQREKWRLSSRKRFSNSRNRDLDRA